MMVQLLKLRSYSFKSIDENVMIDGVSAKIKRDKRSGLAVVRRVKNMVECGNNCSFSGVVAAISGLKVIKIG